MSDRHEPTDAELFRTAMADVRPLRQDKVAESAPPPPPIPRQALADQREVMETLLSDDYDPEALETGEELVYCKPGLQRRVLRKLRRGHYSLAGELDLHGMTVPMAREALRAFLGLCRARDYRCVRIIHGKGRRSSNRGPVLKAKVDHWLRQRDDVLAFCSARPADGGNGAVYVLLRHD